MCNCICVVMVIAVSVNIWALHTHLPYPCIVYPLNNRLPGSDDLAGCFVIQLAVAVYFLRSRMGSDQHGPNDNDQHHRDESSHLFKRIKLCFVMQPKTIYMYYIHNRCYNIVFIIKCIFFKCIVRHMYFLRLYMLTDCCI